MKVLLSILLALLSVSQFASGLVVPEKIALLRRDAPPVTEASDFIVDRADDKWQLVSYDGPLEGDKCTGNSNLVARSAAKISSCIKKFGPDTDCVKFSVPVTFTECELELTKNKECGTYEFKSTVKAGVTKYFSKEVVHRGAVKCFLPDGQTNLTAF